MESSASDKRPWIEVIEDGKAPAELQAMYDRSRDPRGHVDNILKIHSLDPDSLHGHLELYRTVMRGSPDFSRKARETIAVVVSLTNRCHY